MASVSDARDGDAGTEAELTPRRQESERQPADAGLPCGEAARRGQAMHLDRPIFFKTKLCKNHLGHGCQKGVLCEYAHYAWELRPRPDLRKTKLCQRFAERRCGAGAECTFAHGEQELRGTVDAVATALLEDEPPLASFECLDDLQDWCGVLPQVWRAVSARLGDVPNCRSLAAIGMAALQTALVDTRIWIDDHPPYSRRCLSADEATQIGTMWAFARRKECLSRALSLD